MNTLTDCPLCRFQAVIGRSGELRTVSCPRCGEFAMDREAFELVDDALPQLIAQLQREVAATVSPMILCITSRNAPGSPVASLLGTPRARSTVVSSGS